MGQRQGHGTGLTLRPVCRVEGMAAVTQSGQVTSTAVPAASDGPGAVPV